MDRNAHWENIYSSRDSTQVSWFQRHPTLSLEIIRGIPAESTTQIIDVGGGASLLVDHLLTDGFQNITVLDISAAAIEIARKRLGSRSSAVAWLEADITRVALPSQHYDLWHDRAVFHFLTDPDDRHRYLNAMRHAIKPGGHAIVATFASDGPTRCSDLDIVRYSSDSLYDEFKSDFTLINSCKETHRTPFETDQQFIYCCFQKKS